MSQMIGQRSISCSYSGRRNSFLGMVSVSCGGVEKGCDVNPCILFGVPTNELFEHLRATIAEATPLYELCASVLD